MTWGCSRHGTLQPGWQALLQKVATVFHFLFLWLKTAGLQNQQEEDHREHEFLHNKLAAHVQPWAASFTSLISPVKLDASFAPFCMLQAYQTVRTQCLTGVELTM